MSIVVIFQSVAPIATRHGVPVPRRPAAALREPYERMHPAAALAGTRVETILHQSPAPHRPIVRLQLSVAHRLQVYCWSCGIRSWYVGQAGPKAPAPSI